MTQEQHGVMRTYYRGLPCLKSPFDRVPSLQLIHRLRPGTIVEIESKLGGSALFPHVEGVLR
jgi:cephalosporin hydroxylase